MGRKCHQVTVISSFFSYYFLVLSKFSTMNNCYLYTAIHPVIFTQRKGKTIVTARKVKILSVVEETHLNKSS